MINQRDNRAAIKTNKQIKTKFINELLNHML